MTAALFVHGAGGGGWEWTVWARVFAASGFMVAAPDLQTVSGERDDDVPPAISAELARTLNATFRLAADALTLGLCSV